MLRDRRVDLAALCKILPQILFTIVPPEASITVPFDMLCASPSLACAQTRMDAAPINNPMATLSTLSIFIECSSSVVVASEGVADADHRSGA